MSDQSLFADIQPIEAVGQTAPAPVLPLPSLPTHESVDLAARNAYLEANLETLRRLIEGHIVDLRRTQGMIDVLLGRPEKKQRRKQKEEPTA